jgi:hypothetical protein
MFYISDGAILLNYLLYSLLYLFVYNELHFWNS